MVKSVNRTPPLARPIYPLTLENIARFTQELVKSVFSELSDHAFAINSLINTPLPVQEYVKAALPAATTHKSCIVTVSDEVGGYTLAFSDGTNWRRVQDRAVVS